MTQAMRIAIDGPAGAGKSTVAKILAERLGYTYVDTGAIYRALTLLALREGIPVDSETKVAEWLKYLEFQLKLENAAGRLRVIVNGEDVTKLIRSTEVTNAVTVMAKHPTVRQYLLEEQKRLAAKPGVIMDGRDIGTVIMPDADIKFYLTASLEERARRRQLELASKGIKVSFDETKASIANRDQTDTNRKTAPLTPAEDAILIDTTGLSIEDVVDELLKHIDRVKEERAGAVSIRQNNPSGGV